MRRTSPQVWEKLMDAMEEQREFRQDLCPNCDVPLFPTSGGKMQCRGCGYLVVCCEGPA